MTKTKHPRGSACFMRWARFALFSSFVIPHSSFHLAAADATVETADRVSLRDEARGQDIELFAAWPKGAGKCPVILFSHGAGGSGSTYAPLLEDWAAHGYAVLAPTHDDSLRRGGDIRSAVANALTDVNGFIARVDDVKFLLETIRRAAPRPATASA